MNIVTNVFDALLNMLVTLSERVLPMAPAVIAAGILLFAGAFLARWARFAVEYGLEAVTLDDLSHKVGADQLVQRLGMGRSPTRVAGFCVQWFLLITFLVTAADVVGLPAVREYLGAAAAYLPRVITASVVLGAGLLIGRFVGGIVQGAAMANHVAEADLLGRVCYWAVALFTGAVALARLGIDVAAVMAAYPLAVPGAVVLGAAVAIGMHLARSVAHGFSGGRHSVPVGRK